MGRTRIRWRNAARIGAGLAAAGGLALLAPNLLQRPEPPPLPADIGLATDAAGPLELAEPPDRQHASSDRPGELKEGESGSRPDVDTRQRREPRHEAAEGASANRERGARATPRAAQAPSMPPAPAPPAQLAPPAPTPSPAVPEPPLQASSEPEPPRPAADPEAVEFSFEH